MKTKADEEAAAAAADAEVAAKKKSEDDAAAAATEAAEDKKKEEQAAAAAAAAAAAKLKAEEESAAEAAAKKKAEKEAAAAAAAADEKKKEEETAAAAAAAAAVAEYIAEEEAAAEATAKKKAEEEAAATAAAAAAEAKKKAEQETAAVAAAAAADEKQKEQKAAAAAAATERIRYVDQKSGQVFYGPAAAGQRVYPVLGGNYVDDPFGFKRMAMNQQSKTQQAWNKFDVFMKEQKTRNPAGVAAAYAEAVSAEHLRKTLVGGVEKDKLHVLTYPENHWLRKGKWQHDLQDGEEKAGQSYFYRKLPTVKHMFKGLSEPESVPIHAGV